jgi:hypothetical protein
MSGRQYLDVSHLKISSSGGMRGLLHVTCKTSTSLKALASRVCTNPHSRLTEAYYLVTGSSGRLNIEELSVLDLKSFRLPDVAVGLRLDFSSKGKIESRIGGEEFSVWIKSSYGEIEIIGKRNAVMELCAWLNVPITAFNIE